jgi:uncharacterized membrane protein
VIQADPPLLEPRTCWLDLCRCSSNAGERNEHHRACQAGRGQPSGELDAFSWSERNAGAMISRRTRDPFDNVDAWSPESARKVWVLNGDGLRSAEVWRKAGLALIFAWFLLGGIAHFIVTETVASIVPPYVPFARNVVLATGFCEVAGALALLSKHWRERAGIALLAFTVCVTPVHIEMLTHSERYPMFGEPLLWTRLAMQPLLCWIIWSVTRRRDGGTHSMRDAGRVKPDLR